MELLGWLIGWMFSQFVCGMVDEMDGCLLGFLVGWLDVDIWVDYMVG